MSSESSPLTGGGKGNKSRSKKSVTYAATAQHDDENAQALHDLEQGLDDRVNGRHDHEHCSHPSEKAHAHGGHGHSHGSSSSHSHSHGGSSRLSPRSAYRQGDVEASKRAHAAKKAQREMEGGDPEGGHAGDAGEYIKSIVYGGLDGIITQFATVTSVAGAEFGAAVIVVLGISHLFADGISMGMGDYMSSKAEADFAESERAREKWEMDNAMQGEIDEMVDLYKAKGMDETDAKVIIHTLAKYPEVFLDHMMVAELGLLPPAADQGFSPRKAGFVTMCSFMGFGSIPLLPYLIGLLPGVHLTVEVQLLIAVISTVITLFLLGAFKAHVVETGRSEWWKSGLLMAGNGSLAAAVGYFCGYLISNMMELPPGAG